MTDQIWKEACAGNETIEQLRVEVERLKAEMLSMRVDHGDSILWRRKAEKERDALRAALEKLRNEAISILSELEVFDTVCMTNRRCLENRINLTDDVLRESGEVKG